MPDITISTIRDITVPLTNLIAQAILTLDGATSAAQVLEAERQADVAYDAAAVAERHQRRRGAHDEILTACRQMMADAAVIKARAEIRLADEWDAAQARGEVARAGGNRQSIIHNADNAPTQAELGVDPRQISRARRTRDAERADPDIIRRTVDAAVREGRAPTRAGVGRAIERASGRAAPTRATRAPAAPEPTPEPRAPAPAPPARPTPSGTRPRNQQAIERERRAAELLDRGMTTRQIGEDLGMEERNAAQVIEHVRIFRDGVAAGIQQAAIDPTTLSASAQERLAIAMRQHQRTLDQQFEQRVQAEVRSRLSNVLPELREKERQAQQVLERRRGIMRKPDYDTVLTCVHPDSRRSASDEKLAKAFRIWTDIKPLVLDETQAPTPPLNMPTTVEEWEARRQRVRDERRTPRRPRP